MAKALSLSGRALLLCGAAYLSAGEVSPPILAKFLKVFATTTEGTDGSVACTHFELRKELMAQRVPVNANAAIVWVESEEEARKQAKPGRLLLGPSLDLMKVGVAVAILSEGGRPTIVIHQGNLTQCGVKISDSVLKIARIQR